jgi:hypothetical protein
MMNSASREDISGTPQMTRTAITPAAGVRDPRIRPNLELPTRNFFAFLRETEMEFEGNKGEDLSTELRANISRRQITRQEGNLPLFLRLRRI